MQHDIHNIAVELQTRRTTCFNGKTPFVQCDIHKITVALQRHWQCLMQHLTTRMAALEAIECFQEKSFVIEWSALRVWARAGQCRNVLLTSSPSDLEIPLQGMVNMREAQSTFFDQHGHQIGIGANFSRGSGHKVRLPMKMHTCGNWKQNVRNDQSCHSQNCHPKEQQCTCEKWPKRLGSTSV